MSANLETKSSFIYKINPVVKLISFSLISITGAVNLIYDSPRLYFLALFVMVVILSGRDVSLTIKKSFRYYPMVLILTILLPFSGKSGVLLNVFSLDIYSDGLKRFIDLNILMIMILLFSNLLALTIPVLDLINWLNKFKFPGKILTVLFLVNRILHVIKAEIISKTTAYKSRHKKLLLLNYFSYTGKFLISLFDNLFRNNERLFFALASRNFKGKITVRKKADWLKIDSLVLVFVIVVLLIIQVGI